MSVTKIVPCLLFLLLLFAVKPARAEVSVNVNNSSSGNCTNHIRIETNGVVKEINSTDCSDISLSSDDSNPSSTSQPTSSPTTKPTSTSKPTLAPTSLPTTEPTDSASPSASPESTSSASPEHTQAQQSWFDTIVDSISKIVGSIFGG